jgi:hypothetical protein
MAMNASNQQLPGKLMRREMTEAASVFVRAATVDYRVALQESGFASRQAIYTVALGFDPDRGDTLAKETLTV